MKKHNIINLLGIAFVVAIVSTGVFYGLFVGRMSSSTGSGKTLVVAVKRLNPGAVITAADVKTIAWPEPAVPRGTFETPEQVVGKTVFDVIGEEEPVLGTHLASPESGGGAGVPSGMRAVSVHVTDSSGVVGLLRTGQKVDVQMVVNHGGGPTDTVVRTVLEDLKVLAVSLQPDPSMQGFSLPVVTLLAKPAQADVLALADSGARVRLTLRNPLDDETRSSGVITVTGVLRSTGASKSDDHQTAQSARAAARETRQ